MAQHQADIVIFGAGIAGLWTLNYFSRKGYNVLLLEPLGIGGVQSIASQGIIHSGLKYAFAGKINALAKSISAMPDLWREALSGYGPVDLSAACVNAQSQLLLIPSGFMGGLVQLVTKKTLGQSVREVSKADQPSALQSAGFSGNVIYMDEPVLDVPSVIRALAEPYKDRIRKIDTPDDPFGFLKRHDIDARHIVFTSAGANAANAKRAGHDKGLETQARPLLMGMMRNAPFEIYAHMLGSSDKPVATITTHRAEDGSLIWYLGGAVAERSKEADPREVIDAAKSAFAKYMPKLNLSGVQWATLGIDRFEGKSETDGWMPDTPTIHQYGNILYCWPTKLTFAPLLAQSLEKRITTEPSGTQTDWSALSEIAYAQTPWDKAQWNDDI
jgi:hypothetical protein